DDGLARHSGRQQGRVAEFRKEPARNDALGDRTGGKPPASLVKEGRRLEKPEVAAAVLLRNAYPQRTRFGEAPPQLGIEAGPLRSANSLRAWLPCEPPREGIAEQLLLRGQSEVHAPPLLLAVLMGLPVALRGRCRVDHNLLVRFGLLDPHAPASTSRMGALLT